MKHYRGGRSISRFSIKIEFQHKLKSIYLLSWIILLQMTRNPSFVCPAKLCFYVKYHPAKPSNTMILTGNICPLLDINITYKYKNRILWKKKISITVWKRLEFHKHAFSMITTEVDTVARQFGFLFQILVSSKRMWRGLAVDVLILLKSEKYSLMFFRMWPI